LKGKEGTIMVNENFDKFKKEQQKHQSVYLGGDDQPGKNDPVYNNQEITDKAPGATGRNINEQVK
jgi:hypothetical protein